MSWARNAMSSKSLSWSTSLPLTKMLPSRTQPLDTAPNKVNIESLLGKKTNNLHLTFGDPANGVSLAKADSALRLEIPDASVSTNRQRSASPDHLAELGIVWA